MNIVDSSGWLEYFGQGDNADFFSPAILDIENLLVPSIVIYEVFKRLLLQLGEDAALQAAGIMSLGETCDLTQEVAINAAKFSSEFKLAMADSIILTTARIHDATLWTQEADFEGIDGVQYITKN